MESQKDILEEKLGSLPISPDSLRQDQIFIF